MLVKNNDFKMACENCFSEINIKKFYRDLNLQDIINKVDKEINTNNNKICENVIIHRNGSWEPVIPEYVKSLNKNISIYI